MDNVWNAKKLHSFLPIKFGHAKCQMRPPSAPFTPHITHSSLPLLSPRLPKSKIRVFPHSKKKRVTKSIRNHCKFPTTSTSLTDSFTIKSIWASLHTPPTSYLSAFTVALLMLMRSAALISLLACSRAHEKMICVCELSAML